MMCVCVCVCVCMCVCVRVRVRVRACVCVWPRAKLARGYLIISGTLGERSTLLSRTRRWKYVFSVDLGMTKSCCLPSVADQGI